MDAHVHIHDCFDVQRFFDAAAANFLASAGRVSSKVPARYMLCLTETRSADRFTGLARQAATVQPAAGQPEAAWSFVPTADECCLVARHPVHGEIVVVAGRQIVTMERLEILGLGTVGTWEDGLAASEVIDSVLADGAIPVLPWGFGKWFGRRREVVASLIEDYGDGSLFLGDNSGRPAMMPEPPEFAIAKKSGMRVLPGTDPLPFKSEVDKAGSFGFFIDGVEDRESIWSSVRGLVRQRDIELHNFGSLETPLRFVRNQIAMQYLTRLASRRTAS